MVTHFILCSLIIVIITYTYYPNIYGCFRFSERGSKYSLVSSYSEYSEPLFLTPFVKSGEIAKARKLSLVTKLPHTPSVISYSGFFTVNETYNSNIFFWFVPATNKNKTAPILLWLQGGPGLTGLFGFFVEHGPYVIYSDMTAGLREYAWTKMFHVIYVDNPVGTGFSFTDDMKGYSRNQEQMADNMYEFLRQFFKVFSEYVNNDFYIVGESYGGKYVSSLSYKIHEESNSEIHFKGMAIGNGLCDPESMMGYSDYLYNLGLIDRKEAATMLKLSNLIVKHIRKKRFYEALVEMVKLIIDLNVLPYSSYFKNFTGYNFYYNYLLNDSPADFSYYRNYLNNPKVRIAIHVGNLVFQNGEMAQKNLLMDIMQSVKPKIEVLMDSYRVLFYSGQLDLIVPYPLTVNFLNTVKWKHAEEYKVVDRFIWRWASSNRIAGYVHRIKEFYEVLVRNAGHILPYDQPEVALDLVSRFFMQLSFDS